MKTVTKHLHGHNCKKGDEAGFYCVYRNKGKKIACLKSENAQVNKDLL